MYQRYVQVCLSAVLVGLMSGCSKKLDYYEPLPLYTVLANPENFGERKLEVFGYLVKDEGLWRLYPDPIRAKHKDIISSVIIGTEQFFSFHCHEHWVFVTGKTLPFSGELVEFKQEETFYISSSSDHGYCYESDEIKKRTGKVIHLDANKPILNQLYEDKPEQQLVIPLTTEEPTENTNLDAETKNDVN